MSHRTPDRSTENPRRNIAKTARPDSGELMSSRGSAGIALALSAATSASDPVA
jgi:hypothetical protein